MNWYNRHVLPRLMNLAMRSSFLEAHRQRLAHQARGVVLELGFGSGVNLAYYDTAQVTRLYALEPDDEMLKQAHEPLARASFPVEVLRVGAECIPLADHSVDTVLSTWTLCTIPRVETALAEVHRVLKPEGQFLFQEHGLSPEPGVARWQHRLTPLWSRCAGGCHLDREPETLLSASGFTLTDLEKRYIGPVKLMTYMYEGRACPTSRVNRTDS